MDLNDPRRRLQVLNQSNPSIRLSVAPPKPINISVGGPLKQQKASVGVAKPQRMFVGNSEISPTGGRATTDVPRGNLMDFIGGAGVQGAGGLARDILKTPGFVAPFLKPLTPYSVDKKIDQFSKWNNDVVERNLNNQKITGYINRMNGGDNPDVTATTQAGRTGKNVGGIVKGVGDTAGIIAGGIALVKGVPRLFNSTKNLIDGGKSIKSAVESNNFKELAKVLSKDRNAKRISKNTGMSKDAAQYIAKEDDPAVIESVLRELTRADDTPSPNIPNVPDAPGKNVDTAESLRFTDANKNAKELVKSPKLAKQVGIAATDADPLRTMVNVIANNEGKGQIRDILFGKNGLLETVDINSSVKNRLIKDLVKEKDPERVTELITNAIHDSNKQALTGTADNVAQAAEDAKLASQTPDVPPQPGTADVPVQPDNPVTPATPAEAVGETVNKAADQAVAQAQSAKEAFPNMDPESQKAVQEVMDQLNSAQGSYNKAAKLRKGEKAVRSAKGADAYDAAGGGEAGVRAKLAAQRGKYAQSDYTPISVSDQSQKAILDDIQGSNLMDWEKTNTQNAFRKIWGASDEKPAPHDIKKIKEYFNSKEAGLGDAAEQLMNEAIDSGQKLDMVEQLAGAPRTLMTIGDASAPRQLAVSFARHPIVTTKAYLKSFEHMFSGKKFEASTTAIEKMTDEYGKNYSEFMDKVMNMHLPNIAEKAAEESMSSSPLLGKIPVVGRVVDASNRGMSSAVAHTRFNLAKKFIDDAGGIEEANRLFSKQELQDLGEVLNTITGRGGKKGGLTDKHATILSKTLFSGKLWASRMNMLNPYWYYRLSGPAKAEALKSAASFAASAGVVLALVEQLPGVEVGKEPTSADFGKIKVGNTRYDILGGFQQNIRVFNQIVAGKRTSSTTGETKDVTPSSVLGGMIEGKANPLIGYAYRMLNTTPDPESGNPFVRKDEWGQPVNAAQEAGKLLVPLPVSGVKETADDQGGVKGTLMSLPGFFGAGVQTYGKTPTKDQGKAPTGEGALTKTLEDKKTAESQRWKDIESTLSEDQKTLVSTSEDDLKTYLKDGTINKEQYDFAVAFKQVKQNADGVEIPAEIKNEDAQSFYKKYSSLTDDGQKKYLKGPADASAKAITASLNEGKYKGLDDLKANNRISQIYADYEKKINKEGISAADKLDAKRYMYRDATLTNYSKGVNDVYKEGSSGTGRSLIKDGKVTQKDLDKAITIDNKLYSAGVTKTLKFSKKFRREYGYGIPANPDGTSGSGSGSSKSKRTYIGNLLPSLKVGGPAKKPEFSSRARPQGFKVPGNVRKSVNKGKQIKINL